MRWRSWLDAPASGVRNMAVDHALAEACVASQEGVLRFYRWASPTISLGRNEPAQGLYDASAADAQGVDFVRRPTGGRAVLHDCELTYAVACPLHDLDGLRTLYRRVNEGLASGLRSLGAEVDLHVSQNRAPSPADGPCFRAPVSDEVTWAGRKLVGSAQVRLGRAVLQHGSLIVEGDQSLVSILKGEDPDERPATLAEALGRVPRWEELSEALRGGISEVVGGTWVPGVMSEVERSMASKWESRYDSEEWTWRR
jgi:lipoyl(octanoyl) transferase